MSTVIIGAGFFGAMLARERKRAEPDKRVILLEREDGLLARASRFNQARIHGGYHYPRSFQTAFRARQNYPRFCAEFAAAVVPAIRHHYALARHNSKVAPSQFERFARAIGAPLAPADDSVWSLLERSLIAALYRVDEQVFDAAKLAQILHAQLLAAGVEMRFNCHAQRIDSHPQSGLAITLGDGETLHARLCFNATYAALDQFEPALAPELKRERATLLLIDPPQALSGCALTVMDGPFFSLLPYPQTGGYSLSHVRYTPAGSNQTDALIERIRRDVGRLAPGLGALTINDSWTEQKCVLARHEIDDGRPILLRQSPTRAGLWHVLGAKLDNVYDVLDAVAQNVNPSP